MIVSVQELMQALFMILLQGAEAKFGMYKYNKIESVIKQD